MTMINPKNVVDKAVNEFGFRKTTAVIALGVCCACAGIVIGILAIPNEPMVAEAVQTVTENIVKKENV